MPLSKKVRIEIFIPDLPDPAYARILEELGDELSYAFGGCTAISSAGKYRSDSGVILPDKINILFTDTPFDWDKDQVIIEQYAEELCDVVQQALHKKRCLSRRINFFMSGKLL
ncbi:MAG: hypothetical protein AB1757_27590 [Acidobacteriota bacterium]